MDTTALPEADVQTIWKHACAALQLELSPAVYNTWIVSNPLTGLLVINEQSVVGVITSPTAFHSANVQKNLSPRIAATLSEILAKQVILEFKVGEPHLSTTTTSSSSTPQAILQTQATHTSLESTKQPPISETASPFEQFSPPPQSTNNSGSPRVEDLFSPANIQSSSMDRAQVVSRQVGLRPDYAFTTFAVSTTNEMAHAAATAVSNNPGGSYNPLFLYGGVGVGKTHLMHAIGHNIIKNNPNIKVLYCTGEEFTNEIVSSIQTKKTLRFKEKYRNAQVLLIDDIQFIAGKNAVQEEFFHTFNALTKQASQVVLTSDRPPHEITLLEDRLRSRFEAGLMIDIQQPSFELRTAILLIKSAALNITIPMELAQIIASKVDSARKIEGIITSIRSEVELKKRPIDIALIDDVLRPETERKRPRLKVNPNDVLRAVANHYHVKQAAIKGQRRVQNLVFTKGRFELTLY